MKGKGYLAAAAAVFAADMASKAYIRKYVPENLGPQEIGDTGIYLQHMENPGFAGGKNGKNPEEVRAFAAGSLAVLIPVYLHLLGRPGHGLAKAGWSLTIGGGLGNLCDRAVRGTVTDFIRLKNLKPDAVGRIVFNAADAAIFAGLVLNLVYYATETGKE